MIFKTIDELRSQFSLSLLCDYFQVSRSGYYAWCKSGKKLFKSYDGELADKIQRLFEERPKGYRYITAQLKRKFQLSRNPKTVLRYMRILGLKSPIRKKKYRQPQAKDRQASVKAQPNQLNREFKATAPMQKLVTDVSYLYHRRGRLFLSVIKDLYDNSILAYQLSSSNNLELVMDNLAAVFTAPLEFRSHTF